MRDNPIIDALNSEGFQEGLGAFNALGGAVGSVREGGALAAASEADARAFDLEAEAIKLQAQQSEVIRRQELGRTLATQAAYASARGLGLDSGTRGTLADEATREAGSDIRAINLTGLLNALRAGQAASNARFEGGVARRLGFSQGVDILADYAARRARIGIAEPRRVAMPPLPAPKPVRKPPHGGV